MAKPENEWRVSWSMWPRVASEPCRTEKVYRDEAEARDHLDGLRSMRADHVPRPCDEHVWDIDFEVREQSEWKAAR